MKKIELLAPARDLASGIAAIECGADAVYIGGPGFGARQAASNSVEDIRRLLAYAHPFGAKVYAAMNTLLYESELRQAETIARELISAGIDALIIQDMAFLRMDLPPVRLHASTQMCNTSPEGVRFLQECGFSRAVLERGLTLEQVKEISANTDIELEAFIHGAICVGFSGQCYMSRSMGSRSGNRGNCSQPCRMSYDLTDEQGKTLISGKYLLSVQDLNLSSRLGQLIDAGVTSFKIEGRLKDTTYIKNTVTNYRRELDGILLSRNDLERGSAGRSAAEFDSDTAKSFSRGGTVWMTDGKYPGVANFDTPKSTGEYMGTVVSVGNDYLSLDEERKFLPGDGICFFSGERLTGTNVNKAKNGKIYPNRMDGLAEGTKIYRNYDRGFAALSSSASPKRKIGVAADIKVSPSSVSFTLSDDNGTKTTCIREKIPETAGNGQMMLQTIKAQLTKTGSTIFDIDMITVRSDKEVPFVPVSVLNGLRREVTGKLADLLAEKHEKQRSDTVPPRENLSYPYPGQTIGGEANVTNTLSERFYRDHGVKEISRGFDLCDDFDGVRVMTSAYCLRREIGRCLKDNPGERQALYLVRGKLRYRLEFDCINCMMNIIKEK